MLERFCHNPDVIVLNPSRVEVWVHSPSTLGVDIVSFYLQKNLLLCVVLETGGIASNVMGVVPLDTFYVDQAKAALLQMESHDVLLHCRRR